MVSVSLLSDYDHERWLKTSMEVQIQDKPKHLAWIPSNFVAEVKHYTQYPKVYSYFSEKTI